MSDDGSKKVACDRCHRRKAKCDKILPRCSSCAKAEVPCTYSTKDPVIRRQDMEKLERRLWQMEAKNEALSSQLREAQRRITATSPPSVPQSNSGLQQPATNNNEVASQVTFLSLGAGGERQYLGSTSGLLLASLLQADNRAKVRGVQDDEDYNSGRTFGSAVRGGAATPDVGSLPSEKLARSLVSAYLAHDHLCYPFLHPKSLLSSLDSIYSDNSFYRKRHVEAFTLDMILAIATAQVSKLDWQVMPDAETHHDRAMSRLGIVLGNGGSIALQALLLLCQYRIGSGLYDASASLWHLVGTAARMCFELGLHRESVYYSPEPAATEIDEAAFEDSEVRRRCFWCVLAMDRITSITLGRPLAIHLDDFDTELPRAEANIVVSPDNNLSPSEPVGSAPYQLRTAIFVLIVRYRLICGKVLTSLHNVIRSKADSSFDFESRRRHIIEELESWRADSFTLPIGGSLSDSDRSSFRSREWYDLLYQNAILMLYRPSPSFHDVLSSIDTLQRIYDASQKSIAIYAYLHKSRRINYTSMTLHGVFIAGLSYIYAIRSHLQIRRRELLTGISGPSPGGLSADPTINQMVNTTRDCSNVLVAVSERWSTARNAHQVFGRLSDALLSELIEFQSQARNGLGNGGSQYPVAGQEQDQNMSTMSITPAARQQFFSSTAPNGMDFSYQDCFQDLQNLYTTYDFANVSMMQASQDWLYEIQSLDHSIGAGAYVDGAN
ncbi:uncharacterized protein PV07_04770 [Cladophialophora immunda]|uniref:Zn(2)-C6 fungal-type domain-containing protein n=1 Tax=Cladophialophora immunda TaxID=569365 RepID=A0A0D2AUK7_9EURO|nr:uncharacterized protein PV07_04770 [Cladophialophora immunda]KIW28917.1 hypothetical protein PV07_04770 [Cladophialophora immunda]